ncbi:MAG: hypothetical protein GYA55_04120 [SAR324 cluster bacterium]|uniref:Uncharacterized protein n=1 Tax=SAR324 cluster bacterium TaxID=2024889 RepID=A0A7X9FQI0_9DELT|nr:hypothetical protein [SAR324 cluster bacterium]
MRMSQRQLFLQALRALLRPISRFCLKRSIRLQDFIEIAKSVFLEAAAEQVRLQGAIVSTSRLSVITGLHRRDVMRLFNKQESKLGTDTSLVARVIGQWQQDPRFSSKSGKAKILKLEGKCSEFTELVRSVSKDLNPYTVLFELERIGAVSRQQGTICLQSAVYVPTGDVAQGLSLLAADSADLIAAVDENIFSPKELPNLHIKTQYDNLCVENVPEIRKWFLEKGEKFHKEARSFLSKFDKDINPKLKNKTGGARAAIATFSFIEEKMEQSTKID